MARVLIAEPADDDIAEILSYLASNAGNAVAERYVLLFERHFDHLTDHPYFGAARPALGSETRIGVVAPYVIIYGYDDVQDCVTVFRVVHGRRRISGRML